MTPTLKEFTEALSESRIKITRFDPKNTRCITISTGGTLPIETFCKKMSEALMTAKMATKFPNVTEACFDSEKMAEYIDEYARAKGIHVRANEEESERELPPELANLVLNIDVSAEEPKFFMTTPEEYVSLYSAKFYMRMAGLKEFDAPIASRPVLPEYMPRSPRGVVERNTSFEKVNVFNTYVPPLWMRETFKVPDKLPVLFDKLIKHLFPLKEEREFFFHWLYHSLFERAPTYLVLCGQPGTGKNRLKLVMRALHGFLNTVDGKRSTFQERFNTQLKDCTLMWLDELRMNEEMENAMKEVQNDTVAIEAKGVDATRATRIHASMVVSNNKLRDNYLTFDARKFVPLQITTQRLENSMTPEEIDTFTRKVEKDDHPDYDMVFIAQIAYWIKKHGRSKKWPNLEYRGPMFYRLAHASLPMWQKKILKVILEKNLPPTVKQDKKKGILWSSLHDWFISTKKSQDKFLLNTDYSTVQHFFSIFRDGEGKEVFTTELIEGDILRDFYVKVAPNYKLANIDEDEGEEDLDGDTDEEAEDYDL